MAGNRPVLFRTDSVAVADPFTSLHREVNRLFNSVLGGSPFSGSADENSVANLLAPQMNVSETDKQVRVTTELPGVSEEDIQVDLNDNTLTIRAEKKREHKEDKEDYHFVERSYGTFQRSLHLPFAANPDQVQAGFANGVLTITLPKPEQERSRRIQVQPGDGGQASAQSDSPSDKVQEKAAAGSSEGSDQGSSGAQTAGV